MKIVSFLRKNGKHPKRVVDFLRKETHSSWKSSRISTKKSYNNNGKPWKSSRIFRMKTNLFIFSLFIIFRNFFVLNHFLMFSSFFFKKKFFHFFHFFYSFSSFFFFLLFLFWVARNPNFFLASIASRFLVTFSKKKFEPSREVPLWAFVSFFLLSIFFEKKSSSFFLIFLFFFFFFLFSRKNVFFSFFFYFLQICFIAGICTRVQLFPP